MWLMIGDEITGQILKSDLDILPELIKNEFLEVVHITETANGYVGFSVSSRENADKVYSKFKSWEKNRNRSESRKSSLQILSSGVYDKNDIEDLFEAQEGLCYYTGMELVNDPKNYAIDHVVPVTNGGSSWPKNIVLCLSTINQQKHNHTKQKIFSVLKNQYGQEWYERQKEFCKKVDRIRLKIDKRRRKLVHDRLKELEQILKTSFPDNDIEYSLSGDDVALCLDGTNIEFAAGFVRQKKCFSSEYVEGIVMAVLGKNA
ncbi:MAG: HNH endonuclease domain-containing protein [Pseudohongiella sp.]|nr:HNH endonuclease domain-containing protein [Pseudohongiella sp.]